MLRPISLRVCANMQKSDCFKVPVCSDTPLYPNIFIDRAEKH